MDSILFLLAVVGIVVVVAWSVANDGVPLRGRTRGLLAMRDESLQERVAPGSIEPTVTTTDPRSDRP